jgi:predicted nucleic acid-binding protein
VAIVSDSGPIMSFARADLLGLLQQVVGELIIPDEVYEEIVIHGAGRAGSILLPWIRRVSIQDRTATDRLSETLHAGERAALALATEIGASFLVDDRSARAEAQRAGLNYFGSLRILQEAKERGIINDTKVPLDRLIESGMYVSKPLYTAFLRRSSTR